MPIYEYRCGQCGHQMETIQKLSDAPLEVCPACNQPTLRKKISAAGFRLKGGGWYETDFKSGTKRNISGSGEANASSDSGSSKAASDSASGSSSGSSSNSTTAPAAPSKSSDGA